MLKGLQTVYQGQLVGTALKSLSRRRTIAWQEVSDVALALVLTKAIAWGVYLVNKNFKEMSGAALSQRLQEAVFRHMLVLDLGFYETNGPHAPVVKAADIFEKLFEIPNQVRPLVPSEAHIS